MGIDRTVIIRNTSAMEGPVRENQNGICGIHGPTIMPTAIASIANRPMLGLSFVVVRGTHIPF